MDQKQIERLGELLAASPIDQEIKDAIIENAADLTDRDAEALLVSLEAEHTQLESVEKILKQFDLWQDEQWGMLETKQKQAADRIIDEFLDEEIKKASGVSSSVF
jgi:hypothetical protein